MSELTGLEFVAEDDQRRQVKVALRWNRHSAALTLDGQILIQVNGAGVVSIAAGDRMAVLGFLHRDAEGHFEIRTECGKLVV